MINTRQVGRAFVIKVIEALKEVDSATYEVVGSGAGKEKGDLRIPRFDIVGEAKDSGDKLNMRDWTRQSEKQSMGYNRDVLFWRHPDSPRTNPEIRVDINIDFFKELLTRFGEPLIKKEDRQFKYDLSNLARSAKQVLKDLEG